MEVKDLEAVIKICQLLSDFPQQDQERILRWSAEKAGIDLFAAPAIENDFSAPLVTLQKAIREYDTSKVVSLLDYFKRHAIMDGQVACLVYLAKAGDGNSASEIAALLETNTGINQDQRKHLTLGLVEFYSRTGNDNNLSVLLQRSEQYISSLENKTNEQAHWYNQLGRALYATGKSKEAFEFQKKALELKPEDPAYVYNNAILLREEGKEKEAKSLVNKFLSNGFTRDEDHIELFAELVGREKVLASLKKHLEEKDD